MSFSSARAREASIWARSEACSRVNVIIVAESVAASSRPVGLGRMPFSAASSIEACMTEAASVGLSLRSSNVASTSNRPWLRVAATLLV